MNGVQGELAWFWSEVRRALLHPADFAHSIATEHFGLAGVLVAIFAGAALSLSIDLAVLVSRGIDPTGFISRLLIDAFLLGVRIAVVAAIVASLLPYVLRVLRSRDLTLDQGFTAMSFALAPLLIAPLPALLLALVPAAVPLVALAGALLLGRALFSLGLNLHAILPVGVAVVAWLLIVAGGAIGLADQVSRVRFTALTYAPQLAPAIETPPASGTFRQFDRFSLILPEPWQTATRGIPGEIARFETENASLVVQRASGNALITADGYADRVEEVERRGMAVRASSRRVVRANALVLVDDVASGEYGGNTVLLRQFTTTLGAQAVAFIFRFTGQFDERASLDEAASIASTLLVASVAPLR
ncbi:MAG: hypothetical protein ABR525_07025 [Candidatus Limnocylindria bacterium]